MLAKARILLIDDDYDYCRLMQVELELKGNFEVCYETDSKRALFAAEKLHPDIILLDIKMPGKDGLEILDELKNNIHTRIIPVIILTAETDEETRIKAVQKYCECYFEKTVETKELVYKIKEILQTRGFIVEETETQKTQETQEPEEKKEKEDIQETKIASAPKTPEEKKWSGKKILVVSEDAAVCVGLDNFLSPSGFDVCFCQDTTKAVESFEIERPDVVVVDIALRKIEGTDIIHRFKESKIKSKIIVITEVGEAAVVRDLIKHGADDIIVKPYSLDQLYATIIKNMTT
jgi:DNA-binding response OmpR family regulator